MAPGGGDIFNRVETRAATGSYDDPTVPPPPSLIQPHATPFPPQIGDRDSAVGRCLLGTRSGGAGVVFGRAVAAGTFCTATRRGPWTAHNPQRLVRSGMGPTWRPRSGGGRRCKALMAVEAAACTGGAAASLRLVSVSPGCYSLSLSFSLSRAPPTAVLPMSSPAAPTLSSGGG
jgi:hypothetical protein